MSQPSTSKTPAHQNISPPKTFIWPWCSPFQRFISMQQAGIGLSKHVDNPSLCAWSQATGRGGAFSLPQPPPENLLNQFGLIQCVFFFLYCTKQSIRNVGAFSFSCFPKKGGLTTFDGFGHLLVYLPKQQHEQVNCLGGVGVQGPDRWLLL